MTTKQLYLKTKKNNANTQYLKFYRQSDKDWMLGTLAHFLPTVGEAMTDDLTIKQFVDKKLATYGKYKNSNGGYANNSMWRFWCGLLHIHFNNPHNDISDKQLAGISAILDYVGSPVEFVIDQEPPKTNLLNLIA